MDCKWYYSYSYSNIFQDRFPGLKFFIFVCDIIDIIACTNQSLAAGSFVALLDPQWAAQQETSWLGPKSWPPGAHVPSILTVVPAGQMPSNRLIGFQLALKV